MTTKFDPMDHEVPNEDLAALDALAKTVTPTYAVEVGSWAGQSTMILARHFLHVFAVDHWQGNPADRTGEVAGRYGPKQAFQTFCRNMDIHLLRRVIPCVGHSLTWAAVWPFSVDFVYLDADHRYESVKADIAAWLPRVRIGGILAGHDYGLFQGVNQAVDERFGNKVQKAGRLLWWVKVVADEATVKPMGPVVPGGAQQLSHLLNSAGHCSRCGITLGAIEAKQIYWCPGDTL